MASGFQRAVKFLSVTADTLIKTINNRYPPECFAPALVQLLPQETTIYERRSLTDMLKESFLWAVPKKRRSIEKRRSRRFGIPDKFYKMLVPKTNIIVCPECGSYQEANHLCPSCYAKVRAVTEEMQEEIQKNLGISPVENEVVVLYSDDERPNPDFFKGKRIVEMKKERPKIFCDNLLQKSTQGLNTTTDVTLKKEIT